MKGNQAVSIPDWRNSRSGLDPYHADCIACLREIFDGPRMGWVLSWAS
jgi:hypothetical protein